MVLNQFPGVFPCSLQSCYLPSLIPVAVCCSVCFRKQENFGKGKSTDFQLFDSPLEKDLLFKNSAIGLLKIPSRMDYRLYLGHNYVTAIRNVREGQCKYSGKAGCPQGMWGARQGQESSHSLSGDCQPLLMLLFLSLVCEPRAGEMLGSIHHERAWRSPRVLKAVHIFK